MTDQLLLIAPASPPADLLIALEDDGIRVLHRPALDPTMLVAEALLAVVVDYPLAQAVSICSDIHQLTRQLPILAVTPNQSEARLAVLQAGADDVLTAPLDWIECRLRLPRRHKSRTPETSAWSGMADSLMHDLKSPLATIISSLELLRELVGNDTTYPVNLVDNSLLAARRQNFMIEDLVDYMLLQSGIFPLSLGAVSLNEVMDILFTQIQAPVAAKNMLFSQTIPPDLPLVYADQGLLLRVFNALVDNALKFCIRGNTLKIQAEPNDLGVVVRFTDNGRAVFPEYDDDIFDLSQQWQARRDGSRTSVGMALPFARSALRVMRGDVVAFSGEEWTTFTVQLQVAT